jgi:UDP-glucuronate 4-epimerase
MGKVLITGAAGFIGSNLVRSFIREGRTVVGIDDLNTLNDANMKLARLGSLGVHTYSKNEVTQGISKFQFQQLSLNDELGMRRLFEENTFEQVIHLAAHAGIRGSLQYPQQFLQSNVLGFETLLRCCKDFQVGHLLFASSSSVYGERTGTSGFSEDDNTDRPMSVYAASKKADELLAYTYASLYGLSVTGLRLFTVYGPWVRTDMATSLFMNAIRHDQPITLFNNGEMLRDFTYVDDVVKTITLLTDADQKSEKGRFQIFNVGNETVVRVADYVQVIERLMQKEVRKIFLPSQAGDVPMTRANTDLLRKRIGYAPDTGIEQGLKATVEWFLQQE